MATDKLKLYNDALLMCGDRSLSSLTENREPRHLLDQAWAFGAVDFCLETGQWNFACRTQKLTYTPSIEPDFGYRRAFNKPEDWIRTMGVCIDEYFKIPLLAYTDEAGYWFCDYETIYVRFVSNADTYGNNFGLWPASFQELMSTYLASQVVYKISQDTTKWDRIEKMLKEQKLNAKNLDAMNQATKIPASGSWVRSRIRSTSNRDRGYITGNLIG